jgi:hypothetical protein
VVTAVAVGTAKITATHTGSGKTGTADVTVSAGGGGATFTPITFDAAGVTYTLTGFGGAEDATVAVDPTGGANKAAKVVKSATAELWAGTTVSTGANNSVDKIPFTATSTKMTVRVYSPKAGIPVRLKVEDAADNTRTVETEALTTKANAWETLTFDFANPAAGTAALNLAYTYNKVSIFFNFGTTGAAGGAGTYYFDDVVFVSAGSGSGSTGTCSGTACVDFSEAGIGFGPFEAGGGGTVAIADDPNDAANKVVKFVKKPGDGDYFGTTITGLGGSVVLTATDKTVTMRVYSPAVGTNFLLKFEGGTGGPATTEKDAVTTKASQWETLTFVMPDAGTFTTVVVFPHGRSAVTADTTMYIDELKFPSFSTGGGGGGSGALITFDEVPAPKLTDFGTNGAPPVIATDPAGGTNKVLKVFKYALPAPGSEQWAGVTVSTGANDSIPAIPFTATAKKMTVRVYSPAIGVRVRLKVEDASNTGISCETDAITTNAGAWETLTFDFANPGLSPPVGGGPTSPLDLTKTYNKISIFSDFGIGNGGSAPLPADRVYYYDDITF